MACAKLQSIFPLHAMTKSRCRSLTFYYGPTCARWQALTNIRLSCCGGGTLIPVVTRQHHIETLDMLRDVHAVGPVDLRRVDNFINRAIMGEVSSCQVRSFFRSLLSFSKPWGCREGVPSLSQ